MAEKKLLDELELAKLINLTPDKKLDKLIEMTFKTAVCSDNLSQDVGEIKETLASWPQKCLGQRLECEAKFAEIRQCDHVLSPKKMGAVAVGLLLAILTAVGSAVSSWLK